MGEVRESSNSVRSFVKPALVVKRFGVAGTVFVFGNMRGQRYTKGG